MSIGYDFDLQAMTDAATNEEVLGFLVQLFPHADVRNYVLKFFSTTLTGETVEQLFHILVGKGSNGKVKTLFPDPLLFFGETLCSTATCLC